MCTAIRDSFSQVGHFDFENNIWTLPPENSKTNKAIRRSISTLLSENGVAPHVTEKMLGHTMRGVIAVYNKHDWIKEQAEGYALYCQLI